MKKKVAVVIAGLFAASAAWAEDYAVSGKLSTLGLGIEVTKPFSDSVAGRIGLNGYNYTTSGTESGIDYDFKLKLQTVSALADWYPWQGTFRASAGLMYNSNKLSLAAKPSSGTYTIDNVVYNASEIGSLDGSIKFNNTAPYIGIGWGNPVAKEKDWGFVADIGVLYQNTPKATLNVTCGTVTTTDCPTLQSHAEAERQQLEDALRSFKWYPVVSIGLSKKF